MKSSFVQIEKNFLPKVRALNLRRAFDGVYADSRRTHPKRFMWDHWHLEGQYRMHRTLAREFLPPALYKSLKDELVKYGQDHLGCHSISEPWLSYYTEGDEQLFHSDAPHGPWAYVYSLTDWAARAFRGGETLIFRPKILNYWSQFTRKRGFEMNDLVMSVPAEFNQLLVFDPRLPHGVRRVSGVHDPREGRLVVHGWFVNPEPYVTGALKMNEAVATAINETFDAIFAEDDSGSGESRGAKKNPRAKSLTESAQGRTNKISHSNSSSFAELTRDLIGTVVFRLKIARGGRVSSGRILTNTLVNLNGAPTMGDSGRRGSRNTKNSNASVALVTRLQKQLEKMQMPKARGASELTLPFILD